MGYETQRDALQTFFVNGWADRTPYGLDRRFKPSNGVESVRFNIIDGEGIRAGFGNPGQNPISNVGMVSVQIFTPLKLGDDPVVGHADFVESLFMNAKVNTDGESYSSGDDPEIVDFGANGFVPYIAGKVEDAPFLVTTVNAPFIRTEYNG